MGSKIRQYKRGTVKYEDVQFLGTSLLFQHIVEHNQTVSALNIMLANQYGVWSITATVSAPPLGCGLMAQCVCVCVWSTTVPRVSEA